MKKTVNAELVYLMKFPVPVKILQHLPLSGKIDLRLAVEQQQHLNESGGGGGSDDSCCSAENMEDMLEACIASAMPSKPGTATKGVVIPAPTTDAAARSDKQRHSLGREKIWFVILSGRSRSLSRPSCVAASTPALQH